MNKDVAYIGRDLEAMSFADNYHRWIMQTFAPYLGEHVAEVGAGTGSFSALILERHPLSLSLIEPSREMYQMLSSRIQGLNTAPDIRTYSSIFTEVAAQIKSNRQPDSIIYVNVLEHIPDDEAELGAVRETLSEGGRLFIFVPALQWLYGSFDKQIGHSRRYAKAELEEKCRLAGFKILKSAYFDLIGIVPRWIKHRLLKSNTMELGAVKFYDQYVVSLTKAVECMIAPPIGKNIILIAEKRR